MFWSRRKIYKEKCLDYCFTDFVRTLKHKIESAMPGYTIKVLDVIPPGFCSIKRALKYEIVKKENDDDR